MRRPQTIYGNIQTVFLGSNRSLNPVTLKTKDYHTRFSPEGLPHQIFSRRTTTSDCLQKDYHIRLSPEGLPHQIVSRRTTTSDCLQKDCHTRFSPEGLPHQIASRRTVAPGNDHPIIGMAFNVMESRELTIKLRGKEVMNQFKIPDQYVTCLLTVL